ncbi:MAG: PD-(D/E)XK nuclease domain-containing protein [Prevotella sp.]|nr:PD-(D/E)XK nuclease domain-containing protein [Prevotella sp.]
MLYVIFSLFGRYVEVKVHTPTGRVDIVMKTDKALYLFELKLNRPAAVMFNMPIYHDWQWYPR